MELLRYLHGGAERCGLADGTDIIELDWSLRDALVLVTTGAADQLTQRDSGRRRRDEVEILPPITRGCRIFCVGINYLDHQQESKDVFIAEVPKAPVVFMKDVSTMTGPSGDLYLPKSVSEQYDWEVELGVVIGAPARAISTENAWDVVAGYTVINDTSVRDLQVRHIQWSLGKNAVASTPIGPGIVTRDTIGRDPEIGIELKVNGAVKQRANTRDLIFDIPRLIAEISAATPLLPGDVIATGTPAGVGFKRQPPEFLADGDVMETSIAGIGHLVHTVRTGATA